MGGVVFSVFSPESCVAAYRCWLPAWPHTVPGTARVRPVGRVSPIKILRGGLPLLNAGLGDSL